MADPQRNDTARPGALRRALRWAGGGILTLATLAGAAGAVVLGAGLLGRGEVTAALVAAPPVPVSVLAVELLPGHAVTRRFTGQVEAAARADLGFELDGRIAAVLVEEGDRVPTGAVLARLDTAALIPERAALEADLAALAAEADLARLTLARSAALAERGAGSVAGADAARTGLARAEAGMAGIRARIAGVEVRLEKSVLTAPFAARIGARLADPGQTAAAGQPVVVLHADAPARLRVGLPPDLAARLAVGQAVTVEMGGQPMAARLRQIRPDLDPGTRGREVMVELPAEAPALPGETATLVLTGQVATPGFWAPLAALREGARGSWSVMALVPGPTGERALPAAVEVLHVEGARVFLRGSLPEGARIVAEAPDRVAPGQTVQAAGIETGEE